MAISRARIEAHVRGVITDPATVNHADVATMVTRMERAFPDAESVVDFDQETFWDIIHANDRRGRRCRSGECTHASRNELRYA